MEEVKKKKSKLEYLIVFLLVLILIIFALRIAHILQASCSGRGGSCPVTGMDGKVKPVENHKGT